MIRFDRLPSPYRHLRQRFRWIAAASAIALPAGLFAAASAQDIAAAPGAQTSLAATTSPGNASGTRTPTRRPFRSARLTLMEGEVRVEQASSTANSVAVINMPLIEGTVISSGVDGQAEIEFEDGSLVRMTPNSGISLLNMTVDSSGIYQTRIALLGGLAYFELRAGTKYNYAIDAGGEAISPVENATVRVNFDEPPAVIAVLDGSAHVKSSDGSTVLANAGQTVRVDAESEGGVLMIKEAIAPETWDRWNEDRDVAAADATDNETDARRQFAGNQGYGWSDLDASGSWYDVPGRGEVWQPDVAATPSQGEVGGDPNGDPNNNTGDQSGDQTAADGGGFDPYGSGSWAWTPAGYSWASGYSWGWLPYRCGQWGFYNSFGWGWSPNSFCGAYGFGGYGYGGYGSSFGNVPPGYRRPRRPIPGPGPIHPIVRGRGGPVPVAPVHRPGEERMIAGNVVQPLPSVGDGLVQRSGNVVGSGLRRDYPVDVKTHTPVTGLVATTHGTPTATSNALSAWQPVGGTNGQVRGLYSQQRPFYGQENGAGGRRTPVSRPAPSQGQHLSTPSAPRSAPPAAATHSAPAAAASSPKGK